MKRKLLLIFGVIFTLLVLGICIYPMVEFYKGDKLYVFTYKEDWSEWEEISCYDDGYFYNEERGISLENVDLKKFLFFKVFVIDYKKEDNRCELEYVLEEEYIKDFIKNAEIKENTDNLDIAKLIKGKKAIVGNIRYVNDDEEQIGYISYKLRDKHEEMFVFYSGDLLVIQVGWSDEGPKYIAYK